MKKNLTIITYLLIAGLSFGQVHSKEYKDLIISGNRLYRSQDFLKAAKAFSSAVQLGGDSTPVVDRSRAAFSWVLAENPDSAFYYLNTITEMKTLTFMDYFMVADDEDYTSVHNDPRWETSTDKIFNKARITFYEDIDRAKGKDLINERSYAGFAWLIKKEYDSAFYHFSMMAESKDLTFDDVYNTVTESLFVEFEKGKKGQELINKIYHNLNRKYIPSSAFSTTKKSPKKLLIDGGHYNLHDIEGTYATLAGTLRKSGFEVSGHKGKFDEASLRNTDILIITNPHPDRIDSINQRVRRSGEPPRWAAAATLSAYTEAEASVIEKWVKNCGSFFLILDHAPFGQVGRLLTAVFGIENRFASTYDPLSRDPAVDTTKAITTLFTRSKGLIGKHPIMNGVDSVTTYTGESLIGPPGSDVLLQLPSTASDLDWVPETKQYRNRSAAGRSQAIAFNYGKGRVVMLGEAAITRPSGLSVSDRGNWKLILNILRWLAREEMD